MKFSINDLNSSELDEKLVKKALKSAAVTAGKKGKTYTPEHRAALSAAHKGKKLSKRSQETKTKMSASMKMAKANPCTIDGVTIYRSIHELRQLLGQGKAGSKHPELRMVSMDEYEEYEAAKLMGFDSAASLRAAALDAIK